MRATRGTTATDQRNDAMAGDQPIEAERLPAAPNPATVASQMTLALPPQQTPSKPEEHSPPPKTLQIDPPLRVSPTQAVALVIDAVGFGDIDTASDALQGLLEVPGKIRIIAGDPSRMSVDGGLWDDLPGGGAVRILARSHADYLLVDRLNVVFRRHPEIDADLITCEIASTARLLDRDGMIVRTAFFPVTGPGFTKAEAFEGAIENMARRLGNTLLEDLP